MIDYKIILIIILLGICLIYKKSYKFIGGNSNKNKKHKYKALDRMIKNTNLTDKQILIILNNRKIKYEDLVKKHNNIYNNTLINLSSTDEEIELSELNLEKFKNKLILADININLKNSLINKKNNKNKKSKELLHFYVLLNTVKQYNIYSIILMSKIKQIKKLTLKSPEDKKLKNKLLRIIKKTLFYSTESYNKTNNLYKICIASNNIKINSYKSDLSNARNIAKSLMLNIKNIENKLKTKHILDKEIINKLSEKKQPEVDKIIESDNPSLFDNISTFFQSL